MKKERFYGERPAELGQFFVNTKEMFFYQDMPIKMAKRKAMNVERRLDPFVGVINAAVRDYIEQRTIQSYINSYIYVSAKRLFQSPGKPFNRPGWHSDGYMSNDINYVWYDNTPTIFNTGEFNLSPDHALSIQEMHGQAAFHNNLTFPNNTLLRLDQYNIHRVGDVQEAGMRTFCKVTFSKDKFDLEGNTHNYLLSYDWPMRPRSVERNTPQQNPST